MHDVMNGTIPMHVVAMCILMNVALVLSIAALIKYLIKGGCRCGCNCSCLCCNKKQVEVSSENKACCQ
jgi:hypothetical protein